MSYIAQEVNIDNLKPIVDDLVKDYCVEHNVDENDIPPQMWNDVINTIYDLIIEPNRQQLLKINNTALTVDEDKLYSMYSVYKRLCNSHCQVVNLKGFLDFSGLDAQTLHDWKGGPSQKKSDFHKKIMTDNQQSLEAMLHDRRVNPMKVLPSLNHHHGWSQPGVTREIIERRPLSVSDLPRLGIENVQNAQNAIDQED